MRATTTSILGVTPVGIKKAHPKMRFFVATPLTEG
jgi:hypothetical protein